MWTAIAFYYLCCVCLLPYHLSVECSLTTCLLSALIHCQVTYTRVTRPTAHYSPSVTRRYQALNPLNCALPSLSVHE